MIGFDFDYYAPGSVGEAVSLYRQLDSLGKKPLFFSGGTEVITLGRLNLAYTEAMIDIKRIPECRALAASGNTLTFGSALTLSELHDARVFPLLGETGAGVADRTSRNKITLGGNVCSRFIYKEAALPLLLADGEAVIAGPAGIRRVPMSQAFNRALQLAGGEFLVQMRTGAEYARMPYVTVKRRKASAIDYPLVTIAALKAPSGIRAAFSGLCAFPFRSAAVEQLLNRTDLPPAERVDRAAAMWPAPVLDDIKGSAPYREFVAKQILLETLTAWDGR
ncbi:xanthine dehydrogenase [Cohnella sp. CFH 77786]|uniref:FAD binding domain-containing protein n=1 Tax=Cohnella sp. CFH 77786 TaxID=2662265 RepID=UPI001C60D274|nr:xanthine dehydrogenase [Cohnella sp. CFH 77786]